MFDIRGQQNACDVFTMSFEVGDWNQLRLFAILSKVPYKHIALLKWLASVHLFTGKSYRVGASTKGGSITRNSNTRNRYVFLGDKLMRAVILCQIPDSNTPALVAANNLTLVRMNDYIIDSSAMRVTSLNCATSSLPYFDCAIFRTRDHPFTLAMKLNTSYIASMTFKGKKRIGVGRFDIVELYRVVPGSCKEAFIRRNTESVNLRIGVLYRSRTDARESLPETLVYQHGS